MKKVFIPVDFSPHSIRAAEFGTKIARTLGASCLFYHALAQPKMTPARMAVADYPTIGQIFEEDLNDVISSNEERLRLLSRQLNPEPDELFCQTLVSIDTTTTGIVKYAEFRNIDLIVMGTKGKNELDRTNIGSNTSSVISRTNIPVLAIPAHNTTQNISHILFATDFEDTDIESLRKLTFFASAFNAKISVVHIDSRGDIMKARQVFEHYKEKITNEVPYGCYEFLLLEGKNVLESLNTCIESLHIDLIAMATKKKRLFESVYQFGLTKRMLFHTNIPLLAFHAYDLPGETYF